MIRFAAIRLVEILAMLVLMSVVIYALIGLMPGDPIDLMRSADPRMSAADAARLKALYGLDQPLLQRYAGWAQQALAGDLGYSRLFAAPVWRVLLPRLGNSLLLMGRASFALCCAGARHRGGAPTEFSPRRGSQSDLFRGRLSADVLAGPDPDPDLRRRARLVAGKRRGHTRHR
jgi:hypothetical protein